jgi:4-hydroxy-tetrahydrodipicolinate synthase
VLTEIRGMHLSGTVVPMATPTAGGSGDVDVPTLERFTESLVDAGVHGLFPGSSIGEFSSLTPEQNRTVVETVAAAADGNTTVFAGCGDTSVQGVVDNARAAAAADADVAVVVAPYYLSTTQEGLEAFFTRVADRSPLPLVLYNIPPLTGNAIGLDTVETLAAHEGVVGLKDTSGDLTYHHRLVRRTDDEFAVFQGATELAAASLDLGADGIIAGPANVFPHHLARLYEAHAADDHDAVARLMEHVVAPMVSATADVPSAPAIKHLVAVDGTNIGDALPPLPTLSDAERDRLERAYGSVVDAIEDGLATQ